MTLKITNPGYIDRLNTGADAIDKEMDSIVMRYNNIPSVNAQFFRMENAVGGTYKESTISNMYELPRKSEDADPIPYTNPVQGYPKNFTTVQYRLGVRVERRLTEQEIIPVARRMMGGLANSAKMLQEYAMADILNNATASTAAYLGADGVALASDSHPFEKRQTGTWDNLETASALSHSTFSTARTNLRKRTNEFGYPLVVKGRILMVPPELEEAANVIMASELKSGSSLNDKNVFMNEVQVIVNDYLTDTNAWFLLGDIPKENCGMLFIQEESPNIAPCTGSDISTDIIWAERLRMSFAVGFTVEKNLQYNAGA